MCYQRGVEHQRNVHRCMAMLTTVIIKGNIELLSEARIHVLIYYLQTLFCVLEYLESNIGIGGTSISRVCFAVNIDGLAGNVQMLDNML